MGTLRRKNRIHSYLPFLPPHNNQQKTAALQGIYPPPASPLPTATPTTALALLTPEDCAACLHGSGTRLLQHFVEAQAAALAGVIKTHGLDAGGITAAGGGGGGSIDEVRQTTWAKPVVLRLEALVQELGAALSVPVAGIGLGGGRRGERADHLLAASFAARAGASLSGRGPDRGLERLFTVKVQVAAPVDLAVEPVLLAVLRAACKALVERVRATTLSPRGYCQLQVDVQVLRMAVGAYVKDAAALEALLEEVREMGWE